MKTFGHYLNESNVTGDDDQKPLMTWFAKFEKELKRAGGDYKNIDPTDMLKLYYKGMVPASAAKKLMDSFVWDHDELDYVVIAEGFTSVKDIAKRSDMKEYSLDKSYRRIVKTLKGRPGHEIVLKKSLDLSDDDNPFKESAEIKIRPISGMGLGQVVKNNNKHWQTSEEVIAINQ